MERDTFSMQFRSSAAIGTALLYNVLNDNYSSHNKWSKQYTICMVIMINEVPSI